MEFIRQARIFLQMKKNNMNKKEFEKLSKKWGKLQNEKDFEEMLKNSPKSEGEMGMEGCLIGPKKLNKP